MELTDLQKKILIGVGIVFVLILATVAYGGKPLLRRAGILAPLDCQYSEWSNWKGDEWVCSNVPGTPEETKTRTRTRNITSEPQGKGLACDVKSLTQTEKKICPAVSKDCVEGKWGDWSQPACDKDVNGKFIGGIKTVTRTRSGDIPALFGGKACSPATEIKEVNCPTDCILSDWKAGTTPIEQCGEEGKRKGNVLQNSWRWTKDVLQSPSVDPPGEACGSTVQSRDFQCPKDCVVSDWKAGPEPDCGTVGSRRGNTLDRTYTRTILEQPTADSNGNMGKACPTDLSKIEMNEYQCPKDCVPGPWNQTDNDLVCKTGPRDAYTETGQATRTVDPSQFGGICSTENSQTTKPLSKFCPAIPQNCEVSEWSNWNYSCPTNPGPAITTTMTQTRTITKQPLYGGTSCPELTQSAMTGCPAIPQNCVFTIPDFSPSCPAQLPATKNILQIREPNITTPSNWGGTACPNPELRTFTCPATIINILPLFNAGGRTINDLSLNNTYPNDKKWYIKTTNLILGNSNISTDGKSITLSYSDNGWIVYSDWKKYNQRRIQAKIENLSDFKCNISYGGESQEFTQDIDAKSFFNVDIVLPETSSVIAYPFVIRLNTANSIIRISNAACYENYVDTSFTTIDYYNETDMKNYGGIKKGLDNAKHFCPVGPNYSTGIRQKWLGYNYNNFDLIAHTPNPVSTDRKGDDGKDYNVRTFQTGNSCSILAKNQGDKFIKTTGYTYDLGQLYGGSIGNIDCSKNNNNQDVNAILTEMKLVSQNSNNKGPYALQYTCQPIQTNGVKTEVKNNFMNWNTIYNDRSGGGFCPVNSAITKITNLKDDTTNVNYYQGYTFDTSNLVPLTTTTTNIDGAINILLNNMNANAFTFEENTNTIKYYNLTSPVTIVASPATGNRINSGFKKSLTINAPTNVNPLVAPSTVYSYTCLNIQ